MNTEAEAIKCLSSQLDGVRRCGVRKTICDGLVWASNEGCEYADYLLDEIQYNWSQYRPNFIPDATRFRQTWCVGNNRPVPTIELWEVENYYPLKKTKLESIVGWCIRVWDAEMTPNFEIWTANNRGNGHDMRFSMWEEFYGTRLGDTPNA